jgi:Transglutaminase-like superfamily
MATRKFLTSVHDAWGFLRAYILVIRARRLLERRGLKGAQRVMLRPWETNSSNITADDRLITWVDKAVLAACRWQTRETTCFPRAVAAYSLLRSAGARPVIHIGIRARPFAGHAWVEVDGCVVADSMTSAEQRNCLRAIMSIPSNTNSQRGQDKTDETVTKITQSHLQPQL